MLQRYLLFLALCAHSEAFGFTGPGVGNSCADANESGLYDIQLTDGVKQVYCDFDSEGGPWALVEVGKNTGVVNLRTTASVGGAPIPLPDPGSESRKLSREDMMILYTASGSRVGLKWGSPSQSYIFARNLPGDCLDADGCGSSDGYGATLEFGANRVSATYSATPSSCSLFKWPADFLPSGCSNTGGCNECSTSCHVGTWSVGKLDGAYYNGCSAPLQLNGMYEVWVYSG